ncbi:hypothetical protein Y032_0603g537 [Ancylostoma ceylanicum]|uniref:Uncharacterized protein n=1 Tax=Ancylostoma ceylanicum TaxID=53326 RepID=A0A016WN21_9BILA|nr:hypothetical protein Y032_0603g537 [Ancylostoma ceylanicum]
MRSAMISCPKILVESTLKGSNFSKMTSSGGSITVSNISCCCPSLEQKPPSVHLLQFSQKHRDKVNAQSIYGGIRGCVVLLIPNRTLYAWNGPFKATF